MSGSRRKIRLLKRKRSQLKTGQERMRKGQTRKLNSEKKSVWKVNSKSRSVCLRIRLS
jgi:hypothetical protein